LPAVNMTLVVEVVREARNIVSGALLLLAGFYAILGN